MEQEFDTRLLRMSEARVKEIGVNGSIFINQLRYWLERSENKRNGRVWVYKTYEQWAEELPFSDRTVRRTVETLEVLGVIITTTEHNRKKYDKTKWYAINEEKISELIATGQNGQTDRSKWLHGTGQNDQTNTIEHTENTAEEYDNINRTARGAAHYVSPTGYDSDILEKQLNRIKTKLLNSYTEQYKVENCVEVIAYYMRKYNENMKRPHPLLTDKKMFDVAESLILGTEVFEDLIEDRLNYVSLIQEHFKRNYGMQIDYNICHFVTEGILERLAYETLYI